MTALTTPIDFWSTLKQEAQVVAEKEPLLSSYVHASVLAHHNFESSLSFILSNKMADDVMPALAIREVFDEAYLLEPGISEAAIAAASPSMYTLASISSNGLIDEPKLVIST